ncbi:Uncharacterised protein [Streptococcus pneumoniae]|nr:Uncharacterised protein [Streptococcus pneumoniae]
MILFENLFKPGQLHLAIQTTSASPCRIYVTDFVNSIHNLKTLSVLSTTSKQCFEQLAASFLEFAL